MPMIFTPFRDENGDGVVMYDPDEDAKTGRWCKSPQVPDRCYLCWDKKTFGHYPAEGYYEKKDPDGTVWRYGICRRCLTEYDRRKKKVVMLRNLINKGDNKMIRLKFEGEDIIRGRDYADLGEYGDFVGNYLEIDPEDSRFVSVYGELHLYPRHVDEVQYVEGCLELEIEPYYLASNEDYPRYPENEEEILSLTAGEIFSVGWDSWHSNDIPADWEF